MKRFGQTEGVFSTSLDDRVRETHAQWEGTIMTEEEAMPLLSEFGCRCTVIPLSFWNDDVASEQSFIERQFQLEQEGLL